MGFQNRRVKGTRKIETRWSDVGGLMCKRLKRSIVEENDARKCLVQLIIKKLIVSYNEWSSGKCYKMNIIIFHKLMQKNEQKKYQKTSREPC